MHAAVFELLVAKEANVVQLIEQLVAVA